MNKEDKINLLNAALMEIISGETPGMCIAIKNAYEKMGLGRGRTSKEIVDELFPELWDHKPDDFILFWFDLQEPGKQKRIAILNELITNLNKKKK